MTKSNRYLFSNDRHRLKKNDQSPSPTIGSTFSQWYYIIIGNIYNYYNNYYYNVLYYKLR